MKLKNEDLKRYFKFIMERKYFSSTGSCPSVKLITKAFINKISTRKKLRIVDHISKCSFCAQEFIFLKEIHKKTKEIIKETEKLLEKPHELRIKHKKRFFIFSFPQSSLKHVLTIGVLIFIMIFAIFFVTSNLIKNKESINNINIELINPIGKQKIPFTFEWRANKISGYYILEIYHEQLYNLWISPKLYTNHYTLPPEVLEIFIPGKIYFWKVTIFLRKGQRIESYFQEFEIS